MNALMSNPIQMTPPTNSVVGCSHHHAYQFPNLRSRVTCQAYTMGADNAR